MTQGRGTYTVKAVSIAVGLLLAGVSLVWSISHYLDTRERITPTVQEQDDLQVFHTGVIRFLPGHFDFDTQRLEYAYETSIPTAESFFDAIDAAALRAGWAVVSQAPSSRVYRRTEGLGTLSETTCAVEVNFAPEGRLVHIIREETWTGESRSN